jgi:hypothetical protein
MVAVLLFCRRLCSIQLGGYYPLGKKNHSNDFSVISINDEVSPGLDLQRDNCHQFHAMEKDRSGPK